MMVYAKAFLQTSTKMKREFLKKNQKKKIKLDSKLVMYMDSIDEDHDFN